jgi:hypothetical protein
MTDEELVGIICPIFNDNSYKYYFSPSTIAVGKSLGLKGMEFYVGGRGGALGDCDGLLVAAAFGYFNPIIINAAWTLATAKHPARTLGSAHYECAAVTGREKLSALPNLAEFVSAMQKVFDAMDPEGLALFAAFKSLPLVDDLPGRAMQLAASLREYRGSAHLVAVRVSGVSGIQAHFIKRPKDMKNFGWSESEYPDIDDETRARMVIAEELTDALCIAPYSVLNESERASLVAGAKAFEAALAANA